MAECKNPAHDIPCDANCPACIKECAAYNVYTQEKHPNNCPGCWNCELGL